MGETYYDVLGVDRDATQEEIASAYRRRALEVHPDHSDDPDATEQFKRLSTAESVLSDERERARYDRLGHEGYARLVRLTTGAARESSGDDGTDAARGGSTSGTDTAAGETGGSRSHRNRRRGDARNRRNRTRDRNRSARRTAASRRADERRGSADGTRARDAGADPRAGSADDSTFRYAVHDWTGEVEFDPRTQQLDRHTALVVTCVAVLYPMFVFASLEPAFPLPVNAFLAACTLVFVGYLLTMPRIALATFGGWSLLVPAALLELPTFEPVSPLGALAVAFVWVPLGYALAVRWALRP